MKYSDIGSDFLSNVLRTKRVCSKCEKEVSNDGNFCSHCGHKFKKKASVISKKDILKIINSRDIKVVEDSIETKEVPESDSTKHISDEVSRYCIGGKESRDGCPHISCNGYCTLLIYTSNPPQYRKCMFTCGGSEFAPCSDEVKRSINLEKSLIC